MLSSTPKTRASTSSGAIRPSRVKPATSMRALPKPMSAMTSSAAASRGTSPTRTSGSPHRVTPSGEPRAEPARPHEQGRAEGAEDGARSPRRSSACRRPAHRARAARSTTSTEKTVRAPRVKDWAAARPRTRARSRLRATAPMPFFDLAEQVRAGRTTGAAARRSAAGAAAPPTTATRRRRRRRRRRRPRPRGAPRRAAGRPGSRAESSMPRTTLALASSWPVWHSEGSSAEWAGGTWSRRSWRAPPARRSRPARRRARPRPPPRAVTTPRTVETTTRTRSRRPRSANGDRSGAHTRGRHHPQQPDEAEGRRSAVAVGHDAERDGEGPLGRPGAEEAQLGATQVGVARVAGEGGGGVGQAQTRPGLPHPATVGPARPGKGQDRSENDRVQWRCLSLTLGISGAGMGGRSRSTRPNRPSATDRPSPTTAPSAVIWSCHSWR